MIVKARFRIIGVSPLLMHNKQTVDPLNEYSKSIKKITAKRNKTEADYEQLKRLEFEAALYLSNGEPVIPGELVEGTFFEAAKKTKQGKLSKSCIWSEGNFPLIYDGSRTVQGLYDEAFYLMSSVVVGRQRIMRCRPMFKNWEAEVEIQYDDRMLEKDDIERIMVTAGQSCGLGDWRPRYGRFAVEAIE